MVTGKPKISNVCMSSRHTVKQGHLEPRAPLHMTPEHTRVT